MNRSAILKSLPLELSRRLNGAMEIRRITIAQLSSASNITKSALARLLSDEVDHLPDAYRAPRKIALTLRRRYDAVDGCSLGV